MKTIDKIRSRPWVEEVDVDEEEGWLIHLKAGLGFNGLEGTAGFARVCWGGGGLKEAEFCTRFKHIGLRTRYGTGPNTPAEDAEIAAAKAEFYPERG